jgi:hypothetical protein
VPDASHTGRDDPMGTPQLCSPVECRDGFAGTLGFTRNDIRACGADIWLRIRQRPSLIRFRCWSRIPCLLAPGASPHVGFPTPENTTFPRARSTRALVPVRLRNDVEAAIISASKRRIERELAFLRSSRWHERRGGTRAEKCACARESSKRNKCTGACRSAPPVAARGFLRSKERRPLFGEAIHAALRGT